MSFLFFLALFFYYWFLSFFQSVLIWSDVPPFCPCGLPCFVVRPFALGFSFHLNWLCIKCTTHLWIDTTHTHTLLLSPTSLLTPWICRPQWHWYLLTSDALTFAFCFHPHCTSLGLTKAPPTWIFFIFYYLKHCFLYFSRNILIVTLLDCSLVKCELDSGPLSIHTHETS